MFTEYSRKKTLCKDYKNTHCFRPAQKKKIKIKLTKTKKTKPNYADTRIVLLHAAAD